MGGLLEIVCFNDTEFDGDFMRKNNNNNNIKVNDVLDMSYRKNIIIDSDWEYSDEEFISLIVELNSQL